MRTVEVYSGMIVDYAATDSIGEIGRCSCN